MTCTVLPTMLLPRTEGKIILKCTLKIQGLKAADWIHLAQQRGKWWAVIYRVINLQIPLSVCVCVSCWLLEQQVPFQTTLLNGVSQSISELLNKWLVLSLVGGCQWSGKNRCFHLQGQSEHGYSVHWLYKQEVVSQANEHKMSNLSESQEGERFYSNN